jgi:uncharacterized protein (TIGR02588 family)
MKKNALEWVVFAVSLVVIAVCVGVLGYEQLTNQGAPPHLTATVAGVVAQPAGFGVEILIQNGGDRTAENIHLEVTIEGTSDRAEAVVSYVPYRSQRRAWLVLPTDPRSRQLVVRVLGFEEP